MKTVSLALGLALAATPIAAEAAPAPKIAVVTILLQDRGFHPQVIRLRSGTTYRLSFVNRDRTEHDFFAPRLLNSSNITLAEGRKLHDGRLNVRSHGSASLTLTPLRKAAYDAKSTKALDVASNMTAQVLVY